MPAGSVAAFSLLGKWSRTVLSYYRLSRNSEEYLTHSTFCYEGQLFSDISDEPVTPECCSGAVLQSACRLPPRRWAPNYFAIF
jgi:hypothetical protein